MDYNYHTHTSRCHHATGKTEQYIKNAIKTGIKYLGFSEHIPLMLPDGTQSAYRLFVEETDDYFNELYTLREKYKDQIEINIGFECEFYPDYFDSMLSFAKEHKAEYMILGQHFYDIENSECKRTLNPTEDINDLKTYTDRVITAMNTGKFTYVAHPDIINFTGSKKTYQDEMSKICKLSKEKNIPLEINIVGLREERIYPNPDFFEIAGEIKSPVVIGYDAHDPEHLLDKITFEKAKNIIKKFDLNYIGKPELKKLY